MSKAEALSTAERENIVAHVSLMAPRDHDGRVLKVWIGDYEATIATVEAERDDLEELAEYLADCTEWDELRDALIGHAAGAPKSEGAWRALCRLADKKATPTCPE